jgi:exosortase A-associated hydrolase 1/exosortase A-associated hydrolase 2
VSTPLASDIQPFYLDGRAGPLFALYHAPHGRPRGDLLVVQSFAEELNRCRSMVTLQARALASAGIGTLVIDPYGSGDSGGEFSAGSWDLWLDDLRRGIEWLRCEAHGCRTLWGIRFGALMAAQLAAGDAAIENLLLWQPVTEGKTFLTQFLRIRVAAELQQPGGIRTTEELRRQAAAGSCIEVSGYTLSPALAAELDRARLPPPTSLARVRIGWFEVLAAADSVVPRANLAVVEACQSAGVGLTVARVVGPAFWQLHERVVAEELITATSAWLTAQAPEAPAAAVPPVTGAAATSFGRSSGDHELPLMFECEGERLCGVLHGRATATRRGVVIVVAGGPQYRVGAHRQFVALARKLLAAGYPVLRFDLRGMGDSGGRYLGFEHGAADLRAAIDALVKHQPGIEEVVLFGECESASGILFYAYRDARVRGIVLVNPWVRTQAGQAQVILKHYYLARLTQRAFWLKVLAGEFSPTRALRDLLGHVRTYLEGSRVRAAEASAEDADIAGLPLPAKTAAGLRRFHGRVMFLMSGRDYIAREFDEVIKSSAAWDGLVDDPRVCRRDLGEADHTFSREVWKSQAADWVRQWLGSW